jgi:type II secretory pathway component PulK
MYQRPKESPAGERSITAVWAVALVATVAVGLAAQLVIGWVR